VISDQSPEAQKPEIKVQKNGGPTRFRARRKSRLMGGFFLFPSKFRIPNSEVKTAKIFGLESLLHQRLLLW
jgi:hypothetical protein